MKALSSTIAARLAASHAWSVVIIGAGPAGAAAAIGLARDGCDVLLVDRKAFPREKVCGCCLNHDAVQLLRALDQRGRSVVRTEGVIDSISIASPHASARLALPRGLAVSRSELDAALVRTAIAAGAHFIAPASAEVGEIDRDHRLVHLRTRDGRVTIHSKIAVVADGVGGSSLRNLPAFRPVVARRSHIGISTMTDSTSAPPVRHHIAMHCAAGGYVGAVRLSDGRINIAGAIDPAFMKTAGGPGPAAQSIIRSAIGLDDPTLADARWRGTDRLTRTRSTLAADRLFVLGDAAAYVEPFTGEGITWALQSAHDLVPIVADAACGWRTTCTSEWPRVWRNRQRAAHRRCFLLTRALRCEPALRWSLRAIDHSSLIARNISSWLTSNRHLDHPFPKGTA